MEPERAFPLFLQLDPEIRRLILLECNFLTLHRYSRTSREAREEMKDDMFWKDKTKKDFGTPDNPPFKGFPDSKFSLKYWCCYNQESENPKSWRFIYTECRKRLGDELVVDMKRKSYDKILFLLRVGADSHVYGWLRTRVMLWASRKGQTDIVLELLRNGVDVNERDLVGKTALMMASKKGRFAVVGLLLKYRADPHIENYNGNTALTKAVKGGYFGAVDLLLKAGADPNVEDRCCESALIKASREGYSTIVDSLLEAKADPNVRDRFGETALIDASRYGRITIVDSLLEANAAPNIKNMWGETALEEAYDRKRENVVRSLLEYGAKDRIRPKFYRKWKMYAELGWMLMQAINETCERLDMGTRRVRWFEVLICVTIAVLAGVLTIWMWPP